MDGGAIVLAAAGAAQLRRDGRVGELHPPRLGQPHRRAARPAARHPGAVRRCVRRHGLWLRRFCARRARLVFPRRVHRLPGLKRHRREWRQLQVPARGARLRPRPRLRHVRLLPQEGGGGGGGLRGHRQVHGARARRARVEGRQRHALRDQDGVRRRRRVPRVLHVPRRRPRGRHVPRGHRGCARGGHLVAAGDGGRRRRHPTLERALWGEHAHRALRGRESLLPRPSTAATAC